MSLWYLPGCFPLAFLESCCLFLSSKLTSLHLVPTIWGPSVLPKGQHSPPVLYPGFVEDTPSVSSSSSSLLSSTFWLSPLSWPLLSSLSSEQHFIWQASTASSKWAWSCCSFLCLLYILQHCSSSISALYWKILEGMGENNGDTEEKAKTFLFCFIYCWPRHYHRILQINSIGLQRFSTKGGILLYAKSTHPENIFLQ